MALGRDRLVRRASNGGGMFPQARMEHLCPRPTMRCWFQAWHRVTYRRAERQAVQGGTPRWKPRTVSRRRRRPPAEPRPPRPIPPALRWVERSPGWRSSRRKHGVRRDPALHVGAGVSRPVLARRQAGVHSADVLYRRVLWAHRDQRREHHLDAGYSWTDSARSRSWRRSADWRPG